MSSEFLITKYQDEFNEFNFKYIKYSKEYLKFFDELMSASDDVLNYHEYMKVIIACEEHIKVSQNLYKNNTDIIIRHGTSDDIEDLLMYEIKLLESRSNFWYLTTITKNYISNYLKNKDHFLDTSIENTDISIKSGNISVQEQEPCHSELDVEINNESFLEKIDFPIVYDDIEIFDTIITTEFPLLPLHKQDVNPEETSVLINGQDNFNNREINIVRDQCVHKKTYLFYSITMAIILIITGIFGYVYWNYIKNIF